MSWLITPTELNELPDPSPRVLDVRWKLTEPDGREAYRAGHIPGAVYVDLDAELSDHSRSGEGRHPLPSVETLQDAARRWGLNDGDSVVVYDDWHSQAAARCWWLLRAAGVADIRVLDGGYAAWTRAKLPVATGDESPAPGDITLSELDPDMFVDADGAAALAQDPDATLLDARATPRYRGDDEPMDPRAGHIPGAVSAPTSYNLSLDGSFRSATDLGHRFELLAHGPTAVYCGSGVTACHQILAMAVGGFDAKLFPGSWSQWSADPDRPIATGDAP
ncbi:sulfurtransferase [Mycolicibacterium brumae]|uniref:sulfurtransferase n=1 Tax=Mycolicibacterium brumae TaxID=85968 RepID=UPI000B2ED00C|nr:sulfurtransferase [Mycolicibacterium brumae]MCV7191748.1 sulfurtransferase [Mycolicibacterium brumae]RWA15878.1 hypothetical protein MBRU_10025 [Mycolicibacterium brumae DSM 44177]UWW07053.1 sulfurtransferase [Mycolicibacterium brumae]